MRYPNLSQSKIISFDIETYDPELTSKGPGVYRKDGNILGVAIADEKGFAEYYNIQHKGITAEEKRRNSRYIKEILSLPNQKLAANLLYDLDWLENWFDCKINGKLNDVQIAEPLIDETKRRYNLDALAKQYLGKGKNEEAIKNWCLERGLKGKPQEFLYMMPYELVRDYAIVDAQEPIAIFKQQWQIMQSQGLLDVYDLEVSLLPLLMQMRRVGVPIDLKRINDGIETLTERIKIGEAELYKKYGEFNYNSTKQIASVFDNLGIGYAIKAETSNPSIDADALALVEHPIAEEILSLKVAKKTRDTFLINALTGHNIDGRVHCQFFPLKNDEYGTVSGRLSSANPNLQQIPARNEEMSEICRSCFIPEEGMLWGKLDYSQIEYRVIAHYAEGPKSDMVRQMYNNNPKTDYHQFVMGLSGLERKPAKNLNFGAAYCMGAATCARKFHWTLDEAKELLETYHREVPFVAYTRDKVIKVAKSRGYLKTILGRRARVSEKMQIEKREYSIFNRLIQGTAADIMKSGMTAGYYAGLFNVLVPHLTVHDELDISIPQTKEGYEAFRELKHQMEICISLQVPIVAEAEVGSNWAHVSEEKAKGLLEVA